MANANVIGHRNAQYKTGESRMDWLMGNTGRGECLRFAGPHRGRRPDQK